jgi:CRP/FNR family transcriptional regulator
VTTKERLSAIQKSLPFWGELSDAEKEILIVQSTVQEYKPGAIISHCVDADSTGVNIIRRGMARVFISSVDGKQITLQRVTGEQPVAIGISCVLEHITFDVSVEAETQCEVLLIPRSVCKNLFKTNTAAKDSVIESIASAFSKTVSILESVVFTSVRSRLANALIERSLLFGTPVVKSTHASIAADIAITREVVTRILHEFQNDGLVTLQQREIQIANKQALLDMRGDYFTGFNRLIYPK